MPVRKGCLHEPFPDAKVLEAVLEPRVGHPDRQALCRVLSVGVEVEPQLAQPLERLGGGCIGILDNHVVTKGTNNDDNDRRKDIIIFSGYRDICRGS